MILERYKEKLNRFSIGFSEQTVASSFGKTNVIITTNNQKPALFLLHGLNAAAPFALDSVSFLVEKYQIFAIDVLGQPNKSDFVRLSKKNDDYGKWLLEIVDYFKLDNYSLCGISFGAFPIIKSLLIDEKKVKNVFLISPAGIVNGNLPKSFVRFLSPMLKFKRTKKEVFLQKCLQQLYDEFDDLTLLFLKDVFLEFKMDFSITPNFKTAALLKIKTPITIIASKNDFFVPALKLKKKCEKSFLNLTNFVVLKNSKHIPTKEILKEYLNK